MLPRQHWGLNPDPHEPGGGSPLAACQPLLFLISANVGASGCASQPSLSSLRGAVLGGAAQGLPGRRGSQRLCEGLWLPAGHSPQTRPGQDRGPFSRTQHFVLPRAPGPCSGLWAASPRATEPSAGTRNHCGPGRAVCSGPDLTGQLDPPACSFSYPWPPDCGS